MTLSTDIAALLHAEAAQAHALVECKTVDDLVRDTLRPLGSKSVHVLVDGGWAMKVACGSLTAKLRALPEVHTVTEEDLREAFFQQRMARPFGEKEIKHVDIVMDSGVPPCKVAEAKARSKRKGARPYEASVSMQTVSEGVDPERFSHSKHLYADFFKRALKGKCYLIADRVTTVDAREGVYFGGSEWHFTPRLPNIAGRFLEADLQIPHRIHEAKDSDAFVVVGTDGDFFTVLLNLLHQEHEAFKDRPIFLFRPSCFGQKKPPECINMNLLYDHWMETHNNLMPLYAAQLFTKCDIEPFRDKKLFFGIGDEIIASVCFERLSIADNARELMDEKSFESGVYKLHQACEKKKLAGGKGSIRVSYPGTAFNPRGIPWHKYCAAHFKEFRGAILYWSRVPLEAENIWTE